MAQTHLLNYQFQLQNSKIVVAILAFILIVFNYKIIKYMENKETRSSACVEMKMNEDLYDRISNCDNKTLNDKCLFVQAMCYVLNFPLLSKL